jgi:hypothetical protein
MKQLSILCIIFSILVGIITWSFSMPLKSKGTAVIYSMTNDGKNGNKPLTVVIPNNLNTKQQKLLNFAYDVAKQDGYKHPAYLQGILMQETRACSIKHYRVSGLTNKVGDRYFGAMQIKLAAAKAVLRTYPEMWKHMESRTDEEIQARLILDDEFNIMIGSKYLLMMGINKDPSRAITAYNRGPGGVDYVNVATFEYTKNVKNFSAKMKHSSENIQADESDIKSINHQQILLASDP